MESKLIVFVVFAILAQSSFVLRSDAYILSEKTTARLAKISLDRKAVLELTSESFNTVIDIVERLAAIQIWNLTAETNDLKSQIAKANARAKDAIKYSSDAILSVLGQNCSDLKKSVSSRDSNMDNVFPLVSIAVELAAYGNFNEDVAGIESLRVLVEKNLVKSEQSAYDAMRSCLNTKDKEKLAAIKVAEAGSLEGASHLVNATFNIIIIYGATVYARSRNVAVMTAIKDKRSYVSAALGARVEHAFSLHSALVIDSDIGLSNAAFKLNSIEYAKTVSFYKWIEGLNVFYEILIASMSEFAVGLSYAGKNVFSRIDKGRAESAAEFMAGFQAFSDSTLIVNPNATNAVADASASFAIGSTELAAIYYGALNVALSEDITYNEANKTIEMLKNKSSIGIPVLGSKVFELIMIGDPKAVSSSKQTALVTAMTSYGKRNFHAIGNLLKITHGRKDISEDDFAAVRTLQKEAVPLMEFVTRVIADTRIDVLIDKLSG